MVEGAIDVRPWFSQTDPLDDVVQMMNQSHSRGVTREWLEAKLAWGRGGVGALAYDHETPVGLVLFGAAPYDYEGKPIDVMLSYDNFVARDFRGRGIFSRLLATAEQACRSSGVALLGPAFPNGFSRPGFAKAGFRPLVPMRSFVHLSVRGAPSAIFSRARSSITSYRDSFIPEPREPLPTSVLEDLAGLERAHDGLRFSLSPTGLAYRFSPARGEGYDCVLTDDFGAIFRVGMRGSLRELQLMASSPRRLNPRESRKLARQLEQLHAPDVISDLRSASSRNPLQRALDGYVGLTHVTTAYSKVLRPDIEPLMATTLNGIDIHTW